MIGFHISHILYAGRRSEVCSTTQVLQPIVDSINLNKKIWDMYFTDLLPRLVKEGHDGTTIFIYKITALHQPLSPFGKDVIATGGVDTHVVIFGQASRQILHTLTGHSQKVTSVKFVPRDELFVTGSGDKMKLILW